MDGQQSLSYVQAPALEVTSTLSDSSGVANGTENTNNPVPAFKQASDSTEIGSYSHEVFFSTTTQETENHQSASNEVSIISALIRTVISVQCKFPLFRINYPLSSEPTSNC
jgi:BRCT domain type II-containing protein